MLCGLLSAGVRVVRLWKFPQWAIKGKTERVDDELLAERITGRFSCARCHAPYHDKYHLPQQEGVCDECGATEFMRRADDNEDTVRKRLAEYHKLTEQILPYYKEKNILRRVDAMAPIDEVTRKIEVVLEDLE